jgi:hypothetical protein
MSMSLKFLPALALAVALSPFAAQARSNPQAPVNHPDYVMTGSATIDHPTTIYSGGPAPLFPVSIGG